MQSTSYDHLDDLPYSVRTRLQQNPVVNTPSHYSIITASPSPSNPQNLQQVMSPRAPNPGLTSAAALQQQQLQQAASSGDQADTSVVLRQLSQVIVPADLISRLETLKEAGVQLGQMASLDHVRQHMREIADELFRRSELLGQCVLRTASGS